MTNNNNSPIIDLLEDIKDWIMENDYECGEQGSEIYERIENILDDLKSGQPDNEI